MRGWGLASRLHKRTSLRVRDVGLCVGQPGPYLLLHTHGLFTLVQFMIALLCAPECGFTQAVGLAPTDHSLLPSYNPQNGPLGR